MARRRKADLPRDGLGRLRAPGEPDEMAHLRGLAGRTDRGRALADGLDLFADGRLFEAYVHLATAWKQTRDDGAAHPARAAAVRHLAQACAGWCHLQRGNPAGATAVLRRARDGLAAAAPGDLPEVDLAALVDLIDASLAALGGPEAPVDPAALRRGIRR